MRKKYRFLALLLAALMLSGCGVERTEPVADDAPAENSVKVAYVPLDDRPNNYECMEYMAQSLDYELLMLAADAVQAADMLIVGGTSLVVYPAAGLIDYYQGHKLVLINRAPTGRDDQADLVLRESLGKVFENL